MATAHSASTRRTLTGLFSDTNLAERAQRKSEGGELGGPTGGRVGILVTIFAAAGLVAALGDWGIPSERIQLYETGIRKGAILILVEPRSEGDARKIEREWNRLGGRDIYYR